MVEVLACEHRLHTARLHNGVSIGRKITPSRAPIGIIDTPRALKRGVHVNQNEPRHKFLCRQLRFRRVRDAKHAFANVILLKVLQNGGSAHYIFIGSEFVLLLL